MIANGLHLTMFLLLSVLMISSCNHSQNEILVLEGSYFGQKPPGLTPELFAPGVISVNGRFEGAVSFSPDLDEIYFAAYYEGEDTSIHFSKLEDDK